MPVKRLRVILAVLVNICLVRGHPEFPELSAQPRHVHISTGESTDTITVTWSTVNYTAESIVLIGKGTLDSRFEGSSKLFVDGGSLKNSQWIHTVTLRNLQSGQDYMYSVGSSLGWSSLFRMRVPKSGTDWSPTIALFGDMGNENAVSLPYLQTGAENQLYDMIIHVGDFAYDMYEDNATRGDLFMEQIEPIASTIPYMTCPGNHEHHYNFSNYKARFTMPQDNGRMFYTFTVGPVRFFSVSTEYYYYYLEDGMVTDQYIWLQDQLQKANSKEAREKHPWLVIFGHRPMYCSNTDHDDCTKFETRTRVGFAPFFNMGLEPLMSKYGVDLALWAHEHSYERLLPLYDRKIMPGPDPESPYTEPRAPVHITSGSAGCREKHDNFVPDPPAWSAFRSADYGFTVMQVANRTHLHLQQLSAEKDLQVIDEFWLIKHEHSAYQHQARMFLVTIIDPFYMHSSTMLLFTLKLSLLMLACVCLYTLLKANFRLLAHRGNLYSKVFHV
eukprot:TRINITY_DN5998_c0_g1_i1.p1 TRINITY_DN5998_c0_g1~~TRINITY_DN5998_c0_g1_i1.p1  ORF type:complete len:500 (-),score=78.08 TRINITY_DN5998_c0_g1_i1:680-2179(-)